MTKVKICGVNDAGGARRGSRPAPIGSASCSFRPRRASSPPPKPPRSRPRVPAGPARVGLFVEPSDDEVAGRADRARRWTRCRSTPTRRAPPPCAPRFGRPVWHAVGVARRSRPAGSAGRRGRLLLDAKSPAAARPARRQCAALRLVAAARLDLAASLAARRRPRPRQRRRRDRALRRAGGGRLVRRRARPRRQGPGPDPRLRRSGKARVSPGSIRPTGCRGPEPTRVGRARTRRRTKRFRARSTRFRPRAAGRDPGRAGSFAAGVQPRPPAFSPAALGRIRGPCPAPKRALGPAIQRPVTGTRVACPARPGLRRQPQRYGAPPAHPAWICGRPGQTLRPARTGHPRAGLEASDNASASFARAAARRPGFSHGFAAPRAPDERPVPRRISRSGPASGPSGNSGTVLRERCPSQCEPDHDPERRAAYSLPRSNRAS